MESLVVAEISFHFFVVTLLRLTDGGGPTKGLSQKKHSQKKMKKDRLTNS